MKYYKGSKITEFNRTKSFSLNLTLDQIAEKLLTNTTTIISLPNDKVVLCILGGECVLTEDELLNIIELVDAKVEFNKLNKDKE